jgi:t-SNARE complex subunit (syntaxin)
MSKIVIEQGSLMDRIENNVFEAKFQVHEGK